MTVVNSQLKYRRAIEWCDGNREKLPRGSKYRLLTTAHLYKLLFAFGVSWDKNMQLWTNKQMENGADVVNIIKPHSAADTVSARTLIRIIAHRVLIGKRVSGLVELCEALNWQVTKVSDPVREADTDFWRVYITVIASEDGS